MVGLTHHLTIARGRGKITRFRRPIPNPSIVLLLVGQARFLCRQPPQPMPNLLLILSRGTALYPRKNRRKNSDRNSILL
ncbi:MAG: hypothetical protein HC942_26435 [Microcoleus sp. SU_5_6]|nr:hypothetical protein [Microcoleus sp. SU_5_6]NJL67313.1 hypothetical protein [Microcoleus sp. SM1_3_4]